MTKWKLKVSPLALDEGIVEMKSHTVEVNTAHSFP